MQTSEALRQFYLGVAGVRLWYAREPMPGAAPSPDYDFGEEPQSSAPVLPEVVIAKVRAEVPPVPAAVVPGREAGRKLDLRSLMTATEAPAVVPEKGQVQGAAPAGETAPASEDPVAVEPAVDWEPAPQLDVHIWTGGDYTLLAGISAEASLRLQETLAINILRSLGESSPSSIGEVHWPLFNNQRVPANSVQDLRSVMAQALSGAKGGKLLVIGIEPDSDGEGRIPWLDRAAEIVFPHTLAELAADGALKRSLWQLLKPLVGG